MFESLFEGLEDCESTYTLPNGKELKIAALTLDQSVDVLTRLKALPKNDQKANVDLYKHVMKLSVVNDKYESYLDDATVNRLARIKGGTIPTDIFTLVMELSRVDPASVKAAKKKSVTRSVKQ